MAHGAAGANTLMYKTLVNAGDYVISFVPAYQQHCSIPKSYGARVERLELREEDGSLPDLIACARW